MAEVYAAKDPQLDRVVALKIILKRFSENDRFQARFMREAQTIAGLEHRAILPVYDFGKDESTQNLYLVMRLMPDVLNKRLERERFIPFAEASLILNRLAVALNRAHSESIVHRDIKPANILLDEEGTVFLADFGLAAPLDKIEAGIVPQSYGGSPYYMAPEQWRGDQVGPSTDIYQLGVTLFEMLTGELPFPDPNPKVMFEQHLNGRIPNACDLNPKLPQKIQPILEKAMAKAPAERFKTVLEFADEVANLLRPKMIKRRYEIKEELQHGRFAIVYKAQDLIDEQMVALKILKQPLLSNHRYQQEFVQHRAQMLRLPEHPALAPVFEGGLHKERPFFAMKFVEGASLRVRYRKEGKLPVNHVCEIAQSLADGLDSLHDNGQVHGDINMGNILIGPNNGCVLTDFQMTAVAEITTFAQDEKAPLGYLPSLAPEQWAGDTLVPQTDVYQFGVLLYELLSGQRPFTFQSLLELQQAVAKEPPPPITTIVPELPPEFDEIFAKALAKRPDNRYARTGALVQALRTAWQSHAFESSVHEGRTHHEAKQWDAAIEAYNQALNIQPDSRAVADALSRAERRKKDEVVLTQCREAIANERWRDADYFLSQASDSIEKQRLQEQVQRKILVEQRYSEGKIAIQQQQWLTAQKLLDEADALEPNYRDVNALLGELAEKIEAYLQQAREAIDQGEHDRALTLLEPVAEHETTVTLREEIVQKQKKERKRPWGAILSRRVVNRLVLLLIAVIAIVYMVTATRNGVGGDPEPLGLACFDGTLPQLQVAVEGGDIITIAPNDTGAVAGMPQMLTFILLLPTDKLSNPCNEFILAEEPLRTAWGANEGGVAPNGRWTATYQVLDASVLNDRIVVHLWHGDQSLNLEYDITFTP
ncbi:MAG: hypothetical protein DHS20C20_07360 [Ardenticatenaceae bacterium]|nr:MAG: hypothetical protein DHS20C20_07360 [Ardenticatenaceae bacterium]